MATKSKPAKSSAKKGGASGAVLANLKKAAASKKR